VWAKNRLCGKLLKTQTIQLSELITLTTSIVAAVRKFSVRPKRHWRWLIVQSLPFSEPSQILGLGLGHMATDASSFPQHAKKTAARYAVAFLAIAIGSLVGH
jgi:hypothetical protein